MCGTTSLSSACAYRFEERLRHRLEHLVREARIDAEEEAAAHDRIGVLEQADDAMLDVLVRGLLEEIAAEETAMADLALVEVTADARQPIVIGLAHDHEEAEPA